MKFVMISLHSKQYSMRPLKQSGVTLIELVIVIVAMGILTPPIASGFKILGEGFGLNRELQMSTAFVQECAEHVLVQARVGNFAVIDNTTCNVLPAIPALNEFSNLTSNLLVTNVTSATETACPVGVSCKDVAVSVAANGVTRAEINLLLIAN